MILSPHIITGAMIGASLSNPYAIPIGAILSHHFLDSIPHYDYSIKPLSLSVVSKISFDIIFGITTVFIISEFFNPQIDIVYVSLGVFFGVLPDGILLLSLIFKNKISEKYISYHGFFHARNKIINGQDIKYPTIFNISTQVAVIIIVAYFLITI